MAPKAAAAGAAAKADSGVGKKRVSAGARPLLATKKLRANTNTAAVTKTTAPAAPAPKPTKPAAKAKAAAAPKPKAAAAAKGKGKGKGKGKRATAAAPAAAADDDDVDAEEREQQAQLDAIMNGPDGDDDAEGGADDDGDDDDLPEDAKVIPAYDRLAAPSSAAATEALGGRASDEEDDSDFSDIDLEGDEFPGKADAPPIEAGKMDELKAFIALTQKNIATHKKQAATAAAAAQKARAVAAAASASGSTAGAKQQQQKKLRAVVYIGHIPYGFFEDQMRGFFSQFGTILNLRLARNKKSGKSKHYAFLEFEEAYAAEVVAQSMNGYMMFGRTLEVHLLPQHKIHDTLFDGANRKYHVIPWSRINKERHNKERTADEQQKRIRRLVSAENKKKAKLKELGIDYEFPGYGAEVPATATHKKFD